MPHVILGLILVIVAICNPSLARRVFGLPERPRRPRGREGLEALDKPVTRVAPARTANADRPAASIPLSEVMRPPPNSGVTSWVWRKPFKPEKMLMYEWVARGRVVR